MNAGGYGTSTTFRLFGVISQMSIGTSSSASFKTNAGFLYYPFASSPTLSATAGDSQVALSWSLSTGFLGWTATSYTIGQSTVSGGPYLYVSAGGLTNSVRTGLSNGTTYFFVIRVQDIFGNYIATSSQVSSTPVASISPPSQPPPSGGGGGSEPTLGRHTLESAMTAPLPQWC